jgi:hypothetical protein
VRRRPGQTPRLPGQGRLAASRYSTSAEQCATPSHGRYGRNRPGRGRHPRMTTSNCYTVAGSRKQAGWTIRIKAGESSRWDKGESCRKVSSWHCEY